MKCKIDGNALCIVNEDFQDLAISDAVFVRLSKKTLVKLNHLENKYKYRRRTWFEKLLRR